MSVDPSTFREALGCFATGVTVVTARAADGELVGITANSFNSVSLSPPLVLFSIDRQAFSLSKFEESRHFAVNVLREEQRDISTTFATRLEDKFGRVSFDLGASGCPILHDSLAVFDCVTRFRYDGGDHVIFVGEVQNIHFDATGRPLLYYRGRYSRLDGESKDVDS